MSDYTAVLLRQLQNRLALDVQRAATFEEKARLTAYWYDLQKALDSETGTD
ncbi:hypothetical protein QEH42_gp165 [Microbacterium phage Pumpernickel]|uniref:Uncharacterized protein n=1 Tax=Microbacterium phage Pumpernickel TaxID=2885983 RepID=A0AAE8Y846_9CAUD|nr:hypothetical protein QEH42_gp002 [Microbacterium phage Pumpernickel]YP_010755293.1 hypothetical protein QEH42_gp165 [Microbacterium phage Pumpernickel]UDL15793.1 hypothetical protein SEA_PUMPERNICKEL_2 [Microbacterium phage Pumpernickel]UDL16053.1 hypothetical protein SEA_PUMPERNICKEL_303 [Microbacterium phage Pumpernickel]